MERARLVRGLEHEFFLKHEAIVDARERVATLEAEAAAILARLEALRPPVQPKAAAKTVQAAKKQTKKPAVAKAAKAAPKTMVAFDLLDAMVGDGRIKSADSESMELFRAELKTQEIPADKAWIKDDERLAKSISLLLKAKKGQ